MTEEEAKTKWCLFVRHGSQCISTGGTDAGVNRYGLENPGEVAPFNACVGSKCMAWRIVSVTLDEVNDGSPIVDGYCGLAGRE